MALWSSDGLVQEEGNMVAGVSAMATVSEEKIIFMPIRIRVNLSITR
jgi:hypothetical protein